MARIIWGVVLAPPIGVLLFVLTLFAPLLLFAAVANGGSPGSAASAMILFPLFGVALGAPWAYAGMVAVGLPAMALLRRMRRESALSYALCGFAGGCLFAPLIPGADGLYGLPGWSVTGYAGMLVLILFWRIARRRRRPAAAGADDVPPPPVAYQKKPL